MKKYLRRRIVRDRVVEIGWWAYLAISEARALRNRQQWRTWLRVVLRLAPWETRRRRSRAAPFMTWIRYQQSQN